MFVVIMISTVITYSAVSMEQITQFSEIVETKKSDNLQKMYEEFDVLSIGNVGDKFNMTVSNNGAEPVHITRLWIENTTDPTWPASKYELDYTIPSGGIVTDIGQSIDLAALDTQSYLIKLVTEQGNTAKMFSNSAGDDSVYLNLRATPSIVSTGFTTTLVLEVINTGSNKLYNLQAEMDAPIPNCAAPCFAEESSAVTPSSFESLDPGNAATFTWVYTIDGSQDEDSLTFTARLAGGDDEATAVVSLETVLLAENADVALETEGLLESVFDDSVLLFHMEQASVPSPGYQMFSAEANGGSAGMVIPMDTHTLGTPFSAFTKNGSLNTIVIDEGTWTGSLALRSDALSPNISTPADIIFHFEDDTSNPDNSEGTSDRDLEVCAGIGGAWCSLGSTICNDDWDNRFEITIDETYVTGGSDLDDFPMLVHITGADFTNNLAAGNDDINDIRFTSAAGALLDYEIEKYDKGTDELIAWVKIPTLDYNTNTIIYMYFDNAETSGYGDEQDAAGTWSNNYVAVYHMDGSGNAIDSTGNGHTGTNDGSTSDSTCAVGDCRSFVTNDEIVISAHNDFDFDAYTIELWIEADNTADVAISNWNPTAIDGWGLYVNDRWYSGHGSWEFIDAQRQTSGWHKYDLVHQTAGVMESFRNSVSVDTSGSFTKTNNNEDIHIGSDNRDGSSNIDADIDEVRISDTARSDGWLETTYNNQNTPEDFFTATVQSAGGGGTPDWQENEGPHGSGVFHFDPTEVECFASSNGVAHPENDLGSHDNTVALWFKTSSDDSVGFGTEQMLVFWEGENDYPNSDYFKVSLVEEGLVLFEFTVDSPGDIKVATCKTAQEYDDGEWHHIVATRDYSNGSDDNECQLYITDIDGTNPETISPADAGDSSGMDYEGEKWYVGSRDGIDSFFDGYIDDVMFWGEYKLTSLEADYLSLTNYGSMAHQFEVNIEVTDEEGNNPVNMFREAAVPIQFQDSKDQGINDDAAYTMFNFTLNSVPEIQVTSMQRLNFSMAFVDSDSDWEALHVDMKIDDEDFVDHFSSYIQIPYPSSQFPNYTIYDPDNEMILYINNVGEDGIYFVYSGTRLVFGGDADSFASQIHYVNGTTAPFEVDSDSDSIYIPAGELAELRFYANPSNHPCQGDGDICSNGITIPDGSYSMSAWINGYTDQGESFGRSIIFGSVLVED